MPNNLPLTIVIALIVALATVATVSAFDDDTPTPTDAGTATPTATQSPEATETPDESDTPTASAAPTPADDTDLEDEEAEEEDAKAEGEDPNKAAQAIADAFGVPVEEVLALHEDGIGFGALFKLYKLAEAKDMTVQDLIAEIEEDGGGWAFGKRFRELTDEEWARTEGLPKNLGQAISGKHGEGDDDETEAASDEQAGDDSGEQGQGKKRGNSGHSSNGGKRRN
jgi:hypothetical protein